ncbi:MAG: glycosyltransferase family 2 protein [Cyanobacteria bacterium P01_G01_bin.38]
MLTKLQSLAQVYAVEGLARTCGHLWTRFRKPSYARWLQSAEPVSAAFVDLQPKAQSDSPIRLTAGGESYFVLVDPNGILAAGALDEISRFTQKKPQADFIYADEDCITPQGERICPFFKPDWAPEYFQALGYVGGLSIYRASLVEQMGGLYDWQDAAQPWHFTLRFLEQAQTVAHIPKVLYHRQIGNVSEAELNVTYPEAAKLALEKMIQRSPYPGWVDKGPLPGFFQVRRQLVAQPLVSIVIPSAAKRLETANGSICLLEQCLQSIRALTIYPNYEIVIVDGNEISPAILKSFAASNVRVVHSDRTFNFSNRMNFAIAHTQGDILLMLNDDIEVLTPHWIELMLELAQQDDIGAVGAKLFFPDGRLQHVGIVMLAGRPVHAFHKAPGDHPGYFGSNGVTRNYLGVTAACLMMRKAVFDEIGGFDEGLPLNFNDVDLCLRAHQAGYRNVVVPQAQLTHYESVSRGATWQNWELKALHNRHQGMPYLKQDPFYNPNLNPLGCNFDLGVPFNG